MNARLAIASALLVATTFTTACGGSGADADTKEVVLMAHDSFAVSQAVLDAFTRETGYTVKVLKGGDAGATVNQAILTKDHPVADALFGVDNTFLSRALEEKLFVKYSSPRVNDVPATFRDATDDRVTPIDYADVCVDYDAAWFGHDGRPDPPNELADLVDPRYKDLTVVENASTSSPGLAFLLATIASVGENGWLEFWKQLRANGVRVVSGWEEAYTADFTAGGGSGDRPIVVSYATDPAADVAFSDGQKQTPTVAVIESTCYRQVEYAGVLQHAGNEKGARALVDFMLTSTFQEDMPLQMYVFPVLPNAALPEVFDEWAARPPSPLSLDPDRVGAQRDEWIRQWDEIVLR